LLIENDDFAGRGLGQLYAYDDPYSGRREGVVVDVKHVEDPDTFGVGLLERKVEPLYQKLTTWDNAQDFWSDDRVDVQFERLKIGVTALRFTNFDPERYASTMEGFDPRGVPESSKTPVMIVLGNDRVGAFAGLWRYLRGTRPLWTYFRYMRNPHPSEVPVLSAAMLVSDLVPGRYRDGDEDVPFVLAHQEPSAEFFEYFGSFESTFQFNPRKYLFARGRPDRIASYRELLPTDQVDREIVLLDSAVGESTDLTQVFR
jgi:hypothetical protein